MKFRKKGVICWRAMVLGGLMALMMVMMAACGNSSEGGAQKKEWVWVPEYLTIEDDSVSFYDMQLVGDALCYMSYQWDPETEEASQSICKYSLTDGQITKTPLSMPESENENWNLNRGAFARSPSRS